MLHCENDMGRFALERPGAYPAGTHWYYSSGSTNIISKLIRKQFSSDSAYYVFANNQLFNRIGMPDAILEVDPSGTRVGSSYLYATARDYARFGLLYMNDGVFVLTVFCRIAPYTSYFHSTCVGVCHGAGRRA